MPHHTLIASLFLTSALAACGDDGSMTQADANGSGGGDGATGERYLPWSPGAVWSYKLTDPDGILPAQTGQLTTLTGPVDVGGPLAGTMALVAHTDQMVGTKDVYEAVEGDLDVRYRTDFFDDAHVLTGIEYDAPYRLKLDESPAHTMPNAAWSVTFTETATGPGGSNPMTRTRTDQWRVISASESVTVIAGTFVTLHVRRTSSSGSIQDYWYARGVGKVKETGGGQDEELESYTPGT